MDSRNGLALPSQKDERAEFLADIKFFAYHGIGLFAAIFKGAIWLIPGIPRAVEHQPGDTSNHDFLVFHARLAG